MGQPSSEFATCRTEGCGQKIVWKRFEPKPGDENPLYSERRRWTHFPEHPGESNQRCPSLKTTTTTTNFRGEDRNTTSGPDALPLEFCAEDSYVAAKSDWEMCNRDAKYRTSTDNTPACGMHIRKLTQTQEEREQREQAQAIAEWERTEREKERQRKKERAEQVKARATEILGIELELATSYGRPIPEKFSVNAETLLEALEKLT